MRDELRVEIAKLSAEVDRQEKEIDGLRSQLATANETIAREAGHWEAFKSMWCPKHDCPVLLRRKPIWDGVERRDPGRGATPVPPPKPRR